MILHEIHFNDLQISANRQRKEFKPEDLVKLADSISQNGLIQPVVVREDSEGKFVLVAGERRVRAMAYIWNFGQQVRCGQHVFEENIVPCLVLGEMDEDAAFEAELEENICRTDLTWQERAAATLKLSEYRTAKALAKGEKPPTVEDISIEIRGPSGDAGSAKDTTRKAILVAKHLGDPDVEKAKTVDEAYKILKRKEERTRNAEHAASVGLTFTAKVHSIHNGSCLDVMPTLPDASYDVILTDPPYGIDADQYGDSGGRTPGAHAYDDSLETWVYLMRGFAPEAFRLAKPQAHLYVFCDIDNFVTLKLMLSEAGWKVFRTPIIWVNPTAMRTPWPENGPQRKYQIICYAMKGSRPVNMIAPDVVSYPSDDNLGHEAQKPVGLYCDALRRSVRAGDSVLDPFCGSGPIFPAAHELKCRATGIELNASAYGVSVKRIESL